LGAGAGRKKRAADDGGEVTHGRGGDDGDAEGSLSYTWATRGWHLASGVKRGAELGRRLVA
jgi:hypothetical protein